MTQRPDSFGLSRFVAIAAAGFALALPAAAQTQLPPPGSYAPADARQDRIEELERQLVQSTAENERLQFQLMQANREITRLRGMVGELAEVNESAVRDIEEPDAAAAPAAQNPASLNPGQARATGSLGTLSASQLPPPPTPVRDPADDLSRARDLLNNDNLAEAEIAFEDFLERYGDADRAMVADARYWLAFTLLARNNYADAAANFVSYLQATPNGPQAPEAQVRLGMALAGMGQLRQACGAYAQLTRRYPNAPARVRNLAAREARAASCPA
jgi:tol-pal system protein YbgF